MTMSIKELRELMKLIDQHDLTEFSMKDGDFELLIRSENPAPPAPPTMSVAPPTFVQAPVAAPAAPATPAPQPAAAAAKTAPAPDDDEPDESKLTPIKSPMIGTFYRSSSPDKPPFIKVGDVVSAGDTVCIVEAMKLFNEIESEVSGRIVKVLVEDKQPIEYDQVLFLVEPG